MSMYTRQHLLQLIEEDPFYSDDQSLVYCLCILTGEPYNYHCENSISKKQEILCTIFFEQLSDDEKTIYLPSLLSFLIEKKFPIPEKIKSDLPISSSTNRSIDFELSFHIKSEELNEEYNIFNSHKIWPIYKILFRSIIEESRKYNKIPNARHLFSVLGQHDKEGIITRYDGKAAIFWSHKGKEKRTTFEDISENRNKLIKKYEFLIMFN